ncbi:MAG: FAD-dependent oxidoreductase [Chloroflexi bacterium]|nr:FAD-dependent oxidoreductase [Chloroflexota bacterium]
MRVVVIGGGVGGFSAAMVARKAGAEVTLIERTDLLGGLGQVAGIGLLGDYDVVVGQERALGGADFVDVIETIPAHRSMDPPGYQNVLTYNVTKLDSRLQKACREKGIDVRLHSRVNDVEMSGNSVKAVMAANGNWISGDVFVDATGTSAGIPACERWGFGCVECILRCPTFGNPGGIIEKKMPTFNRKGVDGKTGIIGTSVMLPISSLADNVQAELHEKGYYAIPVPEGVEPDLVRYGRAGASTTALMDQEITKKNLLLMDIGGFVKVTATGSPLYARSFRKFPGMEDCLIMQPTAGARGHLIIGIALALRDNTLKADGFDNVFCAGSKGGHSMCLMDAMVTGDLAGHNAVRKGVGQRPLELPRTLAAGAYVDLVGNAVRAGKETGRHYGVIEAGFLKEMNVFREGAEIAKEVERAGLTGVYRTKLC